MPRMDKLSNYRTTWETGLHGGSVTYVSTPQCVWTQDGTVTLNSGGWQTVTTKRKMVQAARQFELGYCVFQRKGDWFVDVWSAPLQRYLGLNIPFRDGMTLNPRELRLQRNAELARA